ncbi:hypothetical protein G7046_g7989 [Stylonectria norvegica]|nr:hypothetical protein G7046_g7989 [Stylonectria norvegica]
MSININFNELWPEPEPQRPSQAPQPPPPPPPPPNSRGFLSSLLEGIVDILRFLNNTISFFLLNRIFFKILGWFIPPTIILILISSFGWEILTLPLTWAFNLNHGLFSFWSARPPQQQPVPTASRTSYLTFHPPIPTAEVIVMPEVLGQLESALSSKDASLAQSLALDFQKAVK